MYDFLDLRNKVVNIISVENNMDRIELLEQYALAICVIEELNDLAKSEGLFSVEEKATELEDIPEKAMLIRLIAARVEGIDFTGVINQIIASSPNDFRVIVFYIYVYGITNLSELDINYIINDIVNVLPNSKEEVFSSICKKEQEKRLIEKRVVYVKKFYSSEVYSDDEVFESYINATSEDFRSLTDKDILLIYNKIPEKVMKFLRFADSDVKAKLTRVIKDYKIEEFVFECGAYYNSVADKNGKVKLSAYSNQYNLVMDVHETIFNEYRLGNLEGGSEKIVSPNIVERSMNDHLRNMGFF